MEGKTSHHPIEGVIGKGKCGRLTYPPVDIFQLSFRLQSLGPFQHSGNNIQASDVGR